ncbi:4-carboxymuconolactone decarboxylase /3-oxoadipate enol-lactonase [Rhizobiales bacterium GAS188]|nr:4-carboxymuconolactone decarboxylase /3-oxoadipate enol-lactonase [Rhizobiales bacterium GAS188]
MAFTTREGARLYWRTDGNAENPALLFLNSLGTDHAMWDAVTPPLTRDFHVLRMDTRGHGASDAPQGDYSIPMLAADALAVLDAAGVKRAHICGLSMGGMTALEIAAEHPGRVDRIIGANTSAAMSSEAMRERAALVRDKGMPAIADAVLGRFLTEGFRARKPPVLGTTRSTLLATDPQGYAGCCMAIAGMELEDLALKDKLSRINAPLLVINGAHDISTPAAEHGDLIAAAIPGARTVTLDAGHLSAVEAPEAFAGAVLAFLRAPEGNADVTAAREAIFEAGLAVRRQVLGDAWVDKALASRNALTGEFQNLITRIAWGEIWTRPGLDHRTRRLIVLAVTASLSRWDEFRLHLRAGIEQGSLTLEDVKEALMQIGVYAGVPAANTGMHHAQDILKALGKLD